jgi:DNA topoisomerase IA
MAIMFITETTDPISQYDEVIKRLEAGGLGQPAGRLSHVAAGKDGGYVVVDVWESQAALDRFTEALVPLIQAVGGTTPDVQVHPVHNVIVAGS